MLIILALMGALAAVMFAGVGAQAFNDMNNSTTTGTPAHVGVDVGNIAGAGLTAFIWVGVFLTIAAAVLILLSQLGKGTSGR